MSFCHKHHQQRYHNGDTKLCMFIHQMYVDIFFPPRKAIPMMFERVTTDCQTLQTWIGHNEMLYYNFNALPHALPYILFQFNMV